MGRAAIDIGTNSMRLLIVDDEGVERVRVARVTGLGRGVDAARRFDPEAVQRTLDVFADFRRSCDVHGVEQRRAVATSAARDAEDREVFLQRAEAALGIRPEIISGEEEAELAYRGATAGRDGRFVVIDIGGGSTEFVTDSGQLHAVSVDIGSVRLTDRLLPARPAAFDDLQRASEHVGELFEAVRVPAGLPVIGVAGTWTSLAAIARGGTGSVHDAVVDRVTADRLVGRLAASTVEETAALPGLDPARAPVILAGAVIARQAMRRLGADTVTVSERDLLDGVIAGL